MDVSALQLFTSTTVSELAVKVLAAIAFCIVGRWLIGRVIAVMQAAMNRNNVDPTLTKYLGSIIAVTLNIALVLGILGYFGSTAQPAGGVDVAEAIARLKVAVAAIPNVKSSPAPDVTLLDMNLVGPVPAVRPCCHTDHYRQVCFDTNEAIVPVAQEAGWPAPTPTQITKTMPA
ncbi:MAG: hypothetical protein ACK5Y8_06195 [Betaproteobacteria bacterium]|jgi:hypothetical protein|nr:hypothetical protein [Burkholderiaceae bacterium]MCZ8151213.1 hypothetical protein [Paracoccaceae bacterium]